jgi:hypothetical protein
MYASRLTQPFPKRLLFLLLFVFSTPLLKAQDVNLFIIKDIYGKERMVEKLVLYPDTLVFGLAGQPGSLRKIAFSQLAEIQGVHPDSLKLPRRPLPTELNALQRMRVGQLSAFWVSMAGAALIIALPEAAAPIASIGGIASGISYLTSYSGIRRLHQYRNIPLVKGL